MKSAKKTPSNAQRLVLENLAAGLPATNHLIGRSAHGGYTGTRASLFRNGWIDADGITGAGREAIGIPQAPQAELSQGAYDMLRAAVNVARYKSTRNLDALRQELTRKFPDRGEDVEAALKYWSQSLARRHPDGLPSD